MLHLLAQATPSVAPIDIMALAIQFGFGGLVALILLWFGRIELQRITAAVDRNARAVTMLVLAMPYLPHPFKDSASQLKDEIEDAQQQNPKK